ncbi:hypothetical protein F2P56_000474 [Juglans regia]|uniref:Altered inheritance of mitochondria protein 32-like n=2 Tax=Juglans regia TaxID=51240 RepID=A0A834D7L7_JUGRE|nr:altered inheritance of mitochondria protein 32-like [Juglans regia]KAF5479673.1 hypothetical protein F2P56_000474 [Juglans regia]
MRIAHASRSLISAAAHRVVFPTFPLSLAPNLNFALAFAMASEKLSTLANNNEDDEKYGFQRSEMYTETLAGTVGAYGRHVFLCYKSPEAWPARVEGSESDLLPKLLSSAIKARKDGIPLKTNLTLCEGREGTDFSDGDVLIFPEMIKYRDLKDSEVDSFVEDVLVNGKPWASGVGEVLTGSHVFVCSHGSRDRRCGVCGPVLIEKFKEEIDSRGLKDQVFVSPCSHIGGHKYAGNVIIYSPGPDGKIMGHWYGYVTPDDVPALIDQHIEKGEIIEHLWRGQMGAADKEGGKADKQNLPNGDVKKSKKKPEEISTQSDKDNVAGCCQGANGFNCCRDGSLEQNSGSEENKAGHEKKGLGKLSCWIGSWEQSDVLTAVAVVGAVATVAVAYSFYRRSG